MRKLTPQDFAALTLRLAGGLLFAYYGWGWLFGLAEETGPMSAIGRLEADYGFPRYLGVVIAVALCFASVGMLVGLLTRLAAFAGAAAVAVTGFPTALSLSIWSPFTVEKFGAPLCLFAISLALLFMGGGKASLEGYLANRRGGPKPSP